MATALYIRNYDYEKMDEEIIEIIDRQNVERMQELRDAGWDIYSQFFVIGLDWLPIQYISATGNVAGMRWLVDKYYEDGFQNHVHFQEVLTRFLSGLVNNGTLSNGDLNDAKYTLEKLVHHIPTAYLSQCLFQQSVTHQPWALRVLLAHGANVFTLGAMRNSVLHQILNPETMLIFLENGVNVSTQNELGNTPLAHLLIQQGDLSIRKTRQQLAMLFAYGASSEVSNNAGMSVNYVVHYINSAQDAIIFNDVQVRIRQAERNLENRILAFCMGTHGLPPDLVRVLFYESKAEKRRLVLQDAGYLT